MLSFAVGVLKPKPNRKKHEDFKGMLGVQKIARSQQADFLISIQMLFWPSCVQSDLKLFSACDPLY